ncbi:MAG TPA: GTPase HflX, partial [Dehalococcoidia bacterium]|nr:GTPase HflX [Dehalococcoidia bacterium]
SPTVVAAFRATLEELSSSDLLLHVIDVTHSKAPEQAQVVEDTLAGLGLGDKPRLLVMNKMDLLGEDAAAAPRALLPGIDESPSVLISAAKKWNLESLLEEIEARLVDIDGPLTVVTSAAGG